MIYVGTCGYAYNDWVGPIYPVKTKSPEMLRLYATMFRAVEIDSSYYGVPLATTIFGMDARTPADFRFTFKAPKSVTHPQGGYERVHDDARLLRERLEPLRASGKLAAMLLQFPNAFKPGSETERYFSAVVGACEGVPLVAEFRNRAWQTPATLRMLETLDVGWCNVDMPSFETLMHPSSDAVGTVGYVRFHGRNAGMWWKGTNVTRYDYLYSPDELLPWADRVAEIEEHASDTYVMFNNHANGRAAVNARMMQDMLVERFGDEAGAEIARTASAPEQGELFS